MFIEKFRKDPFGSSDRAVDTCNIKQRPKICCNLKVAHKITLKNKEKLII